MTFIADEGIDAQIVALLRENNYDVNYIAESAPGSSDDTILVLANEEQRILMTRDKDFGELVFKDKMVHSGIILNRLYTLNSESKAQLVLSVIEDFQDQLLGAFTVIQPDKIRIRRL